jgi:hypothetical protein
MRSTLVVIIILGIAMLNGCQKTDPFEKFNRQPVVVIEKFNLSGQLSGQKTDHLTDSVKLGMEYKMEISIDDEEMIKLDFECFSTQKGYDLQIQATSGNTALVTLKTGESGVMEFDFIARDSFGAKGKARVRINAFENIPPVAVMQVTKTGQLSPYEILVDAGNSFDPDKAYGGGVVRYKYKIGSDYEIQTTVSKLKYILPGPGIRNVSVTVQDNQDAWSKEVTQEIIFY